MMWYGQPGGWGWGYGMMGGFGALLMLLAVIAVAALVVGLLRDAFEFRRHRRTASHAALDILDERYARGDIDAEEYRRRRADLLARR